MKVSVILPTYNESGNIVPLIQSIREHVPPGWEPEIIVVDDDSPDGTAEAVHRAFPEGGDVRTIVRKVDRGLALSIRTGVEAATGDQVLVMDTDFTHSPTEIPRMLHIGQVSDIVCGSRFCAGGNTENRFRYLCSFVFNWFVRILLRTQIQDNLSGFFTMPLVKLRLLPYDRIFFGYGDYYFRLLHFAQLQDMTLIEIPCFYRDRTSGQSKTRFVPILLAYTRAVIRFALERKRPFTS